MTNYYEDDAAIRRRVERKLKHRNIWFAHVVIFLLYLAAATTGQVLVNGFILIGWATVLAIHQWWVESIGQREQEIAREIEREQLRATYDTEKPKHHLELSDDGELVEIQQWDEDEKPKNQFDG